MSSVNCYHRSDDTRLEAGWVADYEPFSKRQRKAERSGLPVTYQYDKLPEPFRVQAYYALSSAVGPYVFQGYTSISGYSTSEPMPNDIWKSIEQTVKRERGVLEIAPAVEVGSEAKFRFYLMTEKETPRALDAIEIAFRVAQTALKRQGGAHPKKKMEDAIADLNRRFREHDLGFEFVGVQTPGVIVKVDSQYVHAEVIEPAIASLHAAGFSGPLDEFMKAHQEYRQGHHKDAMNEALKAFESTMKAICGAKGWHYEENWQAKSLIKAMFDNHLIPPMLESYFAGIRTVLESGVPTLRNKQAGHGQGAAVATVPDYVAAFTLHLTAANIVFLMSAYKALP